MEEKAKWTQPAPLGHRKQRNYSPPPPHLVVQTEARVFILSYIPSSVLTFLKFETESGQVTKLSRMRLNHDLPLASRRAGITGF